MKINIGTLIAERLFGIKPVPEYRRGKSWPRRQCPRCKRVRSVRYLWALSNAGDEPRFGTCRNQADCTAHMPRFSIVKATRYYSWYAVYDRKPTPRARKAKLVYGDRTKRACLQFIRERENG